MVAKPQGHGGESSMDKKAKTPKKPKQSTGKGSSKTSKG
jgi:hypothetical protein